MSDTALRNPVVSVGNLSMGGRGKTPIVAHIARILLEAGERPAILSRGYGRRVHEDGVVVVSDGEHLLADIDRSGDEPLMLARAVPGACVFVCDQRALAGALAERHFRATVHVLDDGFQHRAVARDVDIVVIAPEDLSDRPLPFGRLRESVSALGAADAVVFDDGQGRGSGISGTEPVLKDLPSSVRRFSLRRSMGDVRPLESHRPWLAPDKGPVVALAGIARPDRFFRGLRDRGWQVAREISFRDHHAYTAEDVSKLASAVAASGATGVLTTEKDAERLLPWRPFPVRVGAVPLAVTIEPHEIDVPAGFRPPAAFRSWLLERIHEARA